MLLNLSKSFHFDRGEQEYHIHYIFTKDKVKESGVSLEISVAVGGSQMKTHTTHKPMATLHLSNEEIEKMIEEEAVSFFNQ